MSDPIQKKFVLGIVLVDFKTPIRTIDYVKEVLSKIKISHSIVVVNNTDDSSINEQMATGLKPLTSLSESPIHVVTSGSNLGYARGNNFGYSFLKKICNFDYLLFTNNDNQTANINLILEDLIEVMEKKADVGIAGPTIMTMAGSPQNPCSHHGTWRFVFSNLLGPLILFFRFFHRTFNYEVIPQANDGYYPWLLGNFLLVRQKAFEECGQFDPHTFLYAEEKILSERMSRKGYRCYYRKTQTLYHLNGATTRSHFKDAERFRIYFESERYYYRKYRNMTRFQDLLAVAGFRLLMEPSLKLKGVLSRVLSLPRNLGVDGKSENLSQKTVESPSNP